MILCYVTDRKSLPPENLPPLPVAPAEAMNPSPSAALLARVSAAAAAGVDWIQLREKDFTASNYLALTRGALRESAASAARIIVNDRLDVALAGRAHGVHLGEQSLPVDGLRRFFSQGALTSRQNFLLGVSCHSLPSAVAAAAAGADYIFFGPVFDTPAKIAYGPAQGLQLLSKVCRAVAVPVIAIGGIAGENVAACMQCGAAGIAAIRLFQESHELPALVASLRGSAKSSL